MRGRAGQKHEASFLATLIFLKLGCTSSQGFTFCPVLSPLYVKFLIPSSMSWYPPTYSHVPKKDHVEGSWALWLSKNCSKYHNYWYATLDLLACVVPQLLVRHSRLISLCCSQTLPEPYGLAQIPSGPLACDSREMRGYANQLLDLKKTSKSCVGHARL